jgi:hypothetical protein
MIKTLVLLMRDGGDLAERPAAARSAGLKAGVFDPPRAAPEIACAARTASLLKLSQYRGKVVVLEFGYTPASMCARYRWRSLARRASSSGPRPPSCR